MTAATPARRAGNGRRRRESIRDGGSLTPREKAILEFIEQWMARRRAKETKNGKKEG